MQMSVMGKGRTTVPALGPAAGAGQSGSSVMQPHARQPGLRDAYIRDIPAALALKESIRVQHLSSIQIAVDAWQEQAWRDHQCLGSPLPVGREPVLQLPARSITFYSMQCVGKLTVPEWHCSCCKASLTPPPSAFVCFPSTPVNPSLWYDVQVLQTYQRFGLLDGLSATGTRRPCKV